VVRDRTIGIVAASLIMASLVLVSSARAEPPPALRIAGTDSVCPTAKQVATWLEQMWPQTTIATDAPAPGAFEAEVSDQGTRFRVSAGGQERSFDDGARRCAERARHAAVFVAMVLDPPLIADALLESPTPAPPSRTLEGPRSSAERRAAGWQWEGTLGAVVLVAPEGDGRSSAVAQGIAAFARGKRGWHLAFGAALLHGSLRFEPVVADAWWVPIDVAAGFTTRKNAWEVGAEVGPNVALLSIVGENLKDAQRQFRIEVGGRAAAWSRLWLSRHFAASLSVEGLVRPFPHILDVDPRGRLGEMPAIWWGGSVGVAAALD
jgi:hypothetical protein